MKWLIRKDKHEPTPSVDQQRAEKLAELGAQLWTSRLEQGLSLEEMVLLTRIPRRLLQAIEEGNLNELPEPIYIQGLIRQFADALGMNGVDFSSTFPITPSRVSLKPMWSSASISQLRPVHLYLLYIFLIFCSVSGLSQFLNAATLRANTSQNQPKPRIETVIQPQEPRKIQLQQIKDDHEVRQVQIGVTLKEKSWIRVVADGKVQYEGELPQGTHRIWKAQEQLTVRAGNAGGVMVSVNKEQAKQLGEPGKVEEVTVAANTGS